jgi:cardiolipin synthase
VGGDRIVTWPNALSVARLAGVPVFLWLVLGPQTATTDLIAAGILGLAGITDWLDGKLARMLHQESRLGELLDPAADRLYIAAMIIALAVRGIIPWWLVAALAGRELCVGVALLVLQRRTLYGSLQVSFVGKTATLCLMYAFPLVLLGAHGGTAAEVVRVIGWAFAIWGTALYWWAAMLYFTQVRDLVRESGTGGVPDVKGAAAS